MSQSADVIVLGAGAAGCATAYYLAREGVRVRVVEREAIASCASGMAAGLLAPLTGTGVPGLMQYVMEAGLKMHRKMWPALQEEADVDIQARMVPHLELFMDEEEIHDRQEEMWRWSHAAGYSTQWLEPEDLQRLEPRISTDVRGAMLLDSVGILDSYRYTLALAQAAERHGAEFLNGEAIGLDTDGARVTGVRFERGEMACDTVVVAMGPWAGRAFGWLGIDVSVEPLKGQMFYLEGLDPPLQYRLHGPCAVMQKLDGLMSIGATMERAGFDDNPTVEVRDLLMGKALRMLPCLEQQGFVRQTACLRPVSPDRHPILGRAPGWDGVYLAAAPEAQGILISPVIGQAMADLILRGETSMPIAPFTVERFMQRSVAI
jgi:glycine/D-amino acid oxidase-like deaminating enzyme